MRHRHYRLLFIANLAFIVVASLLPSSMPSLWHLDKVGHFVAYASLFTLALFSFASNGLRFALFILAASLGGALEWLQSFVPGREMSTLDAIMNIAGLLFGIFVYRALHAKLNAQFSLRNQN